MARLINLSLNDIRAGAANNGGRDVFALAEFVNEARESAQLDADKHGCPFLVPPVDKLLGLQGNRDLLLAALAILLHNAFKFTHTHTAVSMTACAVGDRISIVVRDHGGDLVTGDAEKMFSTFTQRSSDRSGLGLGLGLSTARQSISQEGGQLTVESFPGVCCAFTIDLPRHLAP